MRCQDGNLCEICGFGKFMSDEGHEFGEKGVRRGDDVAFFGVDVAFLH